MDDIKKVLADRAYAQNENEELNARIAAAKALHFRAVWPTVNGRGDITYERTAIVCAHCTSTGDPYCTVSDEYPCPTLKALGVEDV